MYLVSLYLPIGTEKNNENVSEDRYNSGDYNRKVLNNAKQICFVLD
jgi:hypothetical protein